MIKKVSFTVVVILLLTALFTTGCGQVGNFGSSNAPQSGQAPPRQPPPEEAAVETAVVEAPTNVPVVVAATNTPAPAATNTPIPVPTNTSAPGISLTIINNTDEAYYLCLPGQVPPNCGLLGQGDSSSPEPTSAGVIWEFIGRKSGDKQTYTATGAANQTTTITKPLTAPTETAVPLPTNTPEPPPDPCASVPPPVGADVMARFVNNSGTGVTLYWIERDNGSLIQYGSISPGGFLDQETFAGDRWVAQDSGGGTRLEYTATGSQTQCASIP